MRAHHGGSLLSIVRLVYARIRGTGARWASSGLLVAGVPTGLRPLTTEER